MAFLDIHSHILPGIDDGAKNTKEALLMLESLRTQGVTAVVLTPHFDASFDNIEQFTELRDRSYKKLLRSLEDKPHPQIFLGAEVLYFPGMGKSEDIHRLCIEGTNYILIEFGNVAFNQTVCEDLINIVEEQGLVPIIAHFERYFLLKKYKNLLGFVASGMGIGQINASSLFTKGGDKRWAKKLIKKDIASLIGSDAHSVDTRPPEIKKALDFIGKTFGTEKRDTFITNSEYVLNRLNKV